MLVLALATLPITGLAIAGLVMRLHHHRADTDVAPAETAAVGIAEG